MDFGLIIGKELMDRKIPDRWVGALRSLSSTEVELWN